MCQPLAHTNTMLKIEHNIFQMVHRLSNNVLPVVHVLYGPTRLALDPEVMFEMCRVQTWWQQLEKTKKIRISPKSPFKIYLETLLSSTNVSYLHLFSMRM